MKKTKSFPSSDIKMPETPDDLDRLTDHLVARLRDVQTLLADHQSEYELEYEPEKRTGS